MERKNMGMKMTKKMILLLIAIAGYSWSTAIFAGTLSVPNSFSAGSTTSAADMNSNFSAVETAVNDNDTRISALEASSAPVFQGFSSTTMDGAYGIFAMAQACSSSFAGSKVCTTREIMNSVYNGNASNLSNNAWVLPDLIPLDSGALESTTGRSEGTPVNYFACNGWGSNNTNYNGTAVSSAGRIYIQPCNTTQSVACCK
jgi:hypothetical protein